MLQCMCVRAGRGGGEVYVIAGILYMCLVLTALYQLACTGFQHLYLTEIVNIGRRAMGTLLRHVVYCIVEAQHLHIWLV